MQTLHCSKLLIEKERTVIKKGEVRSMENVIACKLLKEKKAGGKKGMGGSYY